ncbi:uncharacterized protein [Aegilops tauschii subsp. strangulata]|uniref:DUF4220 domain-containing protein n=2 Tax=Aegilops tauschii TaxID=37682 RepID=A0A453QA93_AEGTS|nr:uncharacterized protein LOC109745807 [Aegilops tauschii subsp. strangulata]
MYTVWELLAYAYISLSIHMFPEDGELSLGPWEGAPVAADTPVPDMSPSDMLMLIHADKGLQINLLAMLSAVLISIQVLLGSRRRRSGNKIIVYLLQAAYTVSFPVFVYTIGLIQSVEAPKQLDSQLLWAVGLLLLLGSVDGMSAFSRQEVENSKGVQAEHMIKTVLVLWLLVSRSDVSEGGGVLLIYFLLCWVYSILRVAQRMKALRKASSVHGLVRSAKVVADYMQHVYASDDTIHSPMDMAKCKYLVLGEEKDSSPPSKAPCYLSEVGSKGKLVTFDMIWNSKDKLLLSPTPDDDQNKRARVLSPTPDDDQNRCAPAPLKDTCLSFALFKLLKRRFCPGLPIAEEGDPEALKFVLAEGKHAFCLVEVELSFLYDFFYTKYPALFPAAPVALRVLRFVVLLGLFKVLLLDFILEAITYYAKVPAKLLENNTGYSSSHAVNFILFNNILVVFMILSIDILQDVATGYSNWAIVHYVCDYVYLRRRTDSDGDRSKGWWMTAKRWWNRGFGIRRALIKWVAARRAKESAHWWDNKLGQYSLLNSCGYTAHKTNAFSLLTLRLLEKTGEGRKRDKDVILTDKIKEEVLSSLEKSGGRLSVDRSGGLRNMVLQLHWAPFDLSSSTHTVLVWHIATTICADQDQGTDNPDQLGSSRLVATTLSSYCAYLLAFVPDMLPDHSYTATQILDAVILDARERLRTTKTLSERCKKMVQLGKPKPDSNNMVQDKSILILGASLADKLLSRNDRPPWELLAGFWADLVLFLAPSDKADVHADHLATGGEFMTHLWALLTHAGIVHRPDVDAASHA